MVSFANSDYDFLIKCLYEGSASYRAESLKRLTVLAGTDKKQFTANVRKILLGLQELLSQQKEEINLLSTLLLLEILPNFVSKQVDHILKSKLLKPVIRNLGDINRPSLRKCSHSCLLQYVKNYHNFQSILHHYVREGLSNGSSWQLQQKCINSFQSILMIQVKNMNWSSYELKRWFQLLLDRLKDENNFVSKAAAQCLTCFCKMQSVKILSENLTVDSLNQLKDFIGTVVDEPLEINQQFLEELIKAKIQQLKKKEVKQQPIKIEEEAKADEKLPEKQPEKIHKIQKIREQIKQTLKEQPILHESRITTPMAHNTTEDLRRIEKIRNNLRPKKRQEPELVEMPPPPQGMNNVFGKKLLDSLRNESNWKDRIEAAEEILVKIEINKHKPEIEGVIRSILPTIIRMLNDQNFKLVLIALKILQNIVQSLCFTPQNATMIIPYLIDKLSDPKISIRQSVFKLIKILQRSTDRSQWIEQTMLALNRGANQFQKDELFNLLNYLYDDGPVNYEWQNVIRDVAPFMEDPKTKIKIKALDTLVLVAIKNNKKQEATLLLQSLLSPIFFEMFTQKVSKGIRNAERRQKINIIHAAVSQTMSVSGANSQLQRTIEVAKGTNTEEEERRIPRFQETEMKRQYQTLDLKQLKLNSSIQVARKGLLNVHRKTRRLSMRDREPQVKVTTIKKADDVELVLPSLTKTKNISNMPDLNIKIDAVKPSMSLSKSSRQPYETPKKEIQLDLKGSEYLERCQLREFDDPERQYKTLTSSMRDPDWHQQFDAINNMRRLVENHQEVLTGSGSNSIHILILQLLKMVQSLRSSVSKNAMIGLGEMIVKLKRTLDPEIEAIMQKLLKKAADTNAFISEEGKKCLTLLAINVSEGKVLQVMNQFKESKTFAIKESLISMLCAMIENDRILKKENARIAEMLVYFLNEGHLDLRNKSRVAIQSLCRSLNDWQKILRLGLSTEAYKTILEVQNNSPLKMTMEIQENRSSQFRTIDQKPEERKTTSEIRARTIEMPEQNVRKKANKITNFPAEFMRLDDLYEECKHNDWKKRLQAIKQIGDIAAKYPQQFCQHRSSSKFMDFICQQLLEPNIKVSLNALTMVQQLLVPLRPLFQNNLSIFTNSIFNNLSSNKQQLKDFTEKVCAMLFQTIDIGLLIQHLCHGCLYSLPRSRMNLLTKLTRLIPAVVQGKPLLMGKHVIPLVNKMIDENKNEFSGPLTDLCRSIYESVGEDIFTSVNKPSNFRELVQA